MHPALQRHRPLARLFGQAAAIVAFVAQLALMAAALAEGRNGIGFGEHFDPGGTSSHYVHDEALCAACQARSLHGVARIPHPPAVAPRPRSYAVASRPASLPGSDVHSDNFSRAPPLES
jgi:hypothetical protein